MSLGFGSGPRTVPCKTTAACDHHEITRGTRLSNTPNHSTETFLAPSLSIQSGGCFCVSVCLPDRLPVCPFSSLRGPPVCLPACVPACLSACLPAYLPVLVSACLPVIRVTESGPPFIIAVPTQDFSARSKCAESVACRSSEKRHTYDKPLQVFVLYRSACDASADVRSGVRCSTL